MGGKLSSPKGSPKGLGAVIFKNNYAVQDEFYQPVYVMGYVNNFAVEQYENADPEEGLPCETYDEDEVFAGNAMKAADIRSSHNNQMLIWDGKVLNVATGQFVDHYTGPNDKSVVLRNTIIEHPPKEILQYEENHQDGIIQVVKTDSDHNVLIHATSTDKLQHSRDNLYEDIDTEEIERDSITEKQNTENTEKD